MSGGDATAPYRWVWQHRRKQLVGVGILAVLMLVGLGGLALSGGTSAQERTIASRVGDCFDLADGAGSIIWTDQLMKRPRDERHDAVLSAIVEPPDDLVYPGQDHSSGAPAAAAADVCLTATVSADQVPISPLDEGLIGFLHADEDRWDDGDRALTCYVVLPDGDNGAA